MCVDFQSKWTTFNFSSQICPKMDLGLETKKSNVGIRIRIVEILRANFQPIWTILTSLAQICPKMFFWLEIQKTNVEIRISILKIHVCQFSVKMDNFKFFILNLGKLPNYVRYFGSNNDVTESWVEAEMSWMEVGKG